MSILRIVPLIRWYDRTGAEQPLPDTLIADWSFTLIADGGCAEFSLVLRDEWDGVRLPAHPAVGWRVDFWFNGAPAFRGDIEVSTPPIDRAVPAWSLTGTGRLARAKDIRIDGNYAHPFGGDLFAACEWIRRLFLTPSAQFDNLKSYINPITPSPQWFVERADFSSSDAASALSSLGDAAQGNLLWGFSFDSHGNDKFYALPKPVAVTRPDLMFRIGQDISHLEPAQDATTLFNAVRFIGGVAKAPNVLFNGSFEVPVLAGSGEAGNLVIDPSFELASGSWSTTGTGARVPTDVNQSYTAATGQWMVALYNVADTCKQTIFLPLTVPIGTPFLFVFHYMANYVATHGAVDVKLESLDNSGTFIETLFDSTIGGGTIISNVVQFQEFRKMVSTTLAGCTRVRITFTYNVGPDAQPILLDDVWFYRADSLATDGWEQTAPPGGTASALVDWAFQRDESRVVPAPYHGIYCVRAFVFGTNGGAVNTIRIQGDSSHWSSLRPNAVYRARVKIRTFVVGTFRLGLDLQQSGSTNSNIIWGSTHTTSGTGVWEEFSGDESIGHQAVSGRLVIELMSNGFWDIDACDLFEWTIDPRQTYFPADRVELYFRSDGSSTIRTDLHMAPADQTIIYSPGTPFVPADVGKIIQITAGTGWTNGYYQIMKVYGDASCQLGSSPALANTANGTGETATVPGLTAATRASIGTFRLRETRIEDQAAQDFVGAIAAVAGFLNKNASPIDQGKFSMEPASMIYRFVDPDDIATVPDGLIRIDGFRDGLVLPDQMPVKITYSLAKGGAVRCELECEDLRPDPALIMRQLSAAGGGGGNVFLGGGPSPLPNLPVPGGSGGAVGPVPALAALVYPYVTSGLLAAVPGSPSLTITIPTGTAIVNGGQVVARTKTIVVPNNMNTYIDLDDTGTLLINSITPGNPKPALPSNAMRIMLITAVSGAINAVFDLATRNPILITQQPGRLDPLGLLAACKIPSGPFAGGFLRAPNGYINWYFVLQGLYNLIEDLYAIDGTAIDVFNTLDLYLATQNAQYPTTYQIDDIIFPNILTADYTTYTRQLSDSDDSYAAYFILTMERAVRATGNYTWYNANAAQIHQIAIHNLSNLLYTGTPAAPHITGTTRVFQDASLPLGIPGAAFLEDNTEVARAMARYAALLDHMGDAAASTWAAYLPTINNGIGGFYDATNKWWRANDYVITPGTDFYPDLVGGPFFELAGLTYGAPANDRVAKNDAWVRLTTYAPNFWNRAGFDAFPWSILAWFAVYRRDEFEIGIEHLKMVRERFIDAGGNAQYLILHDVGYIQALLNRLVRYPMGREVTDTFAVARGNHAWDADTSLRTGGSYHDVILRGAPRPGTVVRVTVGGANWPATNWTISGWVLTFVSGYYPVLDEIVTVTFVPEFL